jgi:hypothetical protein
MNSISTQQKHTSIQLTALWAFAESGLGGLMHAFKIPFTGIFVGGMAVLMLILLAHQSTFKIIVQTTLLVMLVKLIASPQSPPPAYLAVAFQGFSAAIIYQLIPHKTTATLLFSILAMMESALQKVIVTTLIYGKAFWQAIDLFSASVLKEMGAISDFKLSWWLICGYCAIYFIWGIVIGFWGLSIQIRKEKTGSELLKFIAENQIQIPIQSSNNSKKVKRPILSYLSFFVILGMLITFYVTGFKSKELLYVLLRSLFALVILIFIINPIIKHLLLKWSEKQSEQRKNELNQILNQLPVIKNNWFLAKEIVRLKESKQFILFKTLETFIFISLAEHAVPKK